MTINGGKIYGPKGSGALFVAHSSVQLASQHTGGGQERGVRSGTENVPGIIGLAAALDLVQTRRREEAERLTQLQSLFFDLILENLPQTVVNGSRKHRLPNNVHLTLPAQDNERLLIELEQHGILAAAGSACSASNEEPSHVLRAMGIDTQAARASLRFTLGYHTAEADVRRTITVLRKILDQQANSR
jgi:cysteine desulfurase